MENFKGEKVTVTEFPIEEDRKKILQDAKIRIKQLEADKAAKLEFTEEEKETLESYKFKRSLNPGRTVQYKNSMNAIPSPGEIKPHLQPSETLQDQSLSIREIVARYQQGLPTNAPMRTPIYDPEDKMPDIRKMDLIDLQRIRDEHKQLKDRLQNEQKQKQVEAQEKQLEKIIEQRMAEKEKQQQKQEPTPNKIS